jgi:hypothetical protein
MGVGAEEVAMMVRRRRLQQSISLKDRLALFAENLRKKASLLPRGFAGHVGPM